MERYHFQGISVKEKNQSDYNAFVSRNKNTFTSVIPKELASAGLSMPDGMILTDGDIPLFISAKITEDIETGGNGKTAVTATGLSFSMMNYRTQLGRNC